MRNALRRGMICAPGSVDIDGVVERVSRTSISVTVACPRNELELTVSTQPSET